ncbi:MAG TPA: hypothetical protein VEJ37_05710 [Xanthobacteraceae bacterium]|nr:hypothetical protein [Xanthobacteraceae bacterium]
MRGKHGRWFSLLVAGFIGYVAGDWHAVTAMAVRSVDFSPSQSVALRFPEAKPEVAAADASAGTPAAGLSAAALNDAQLALFNPHPMVPVLVPQPAPAPQPSESVSVPPPTSAPPPPPAVRSEIKTPASPPPRAARQSALENTARHAARTGFLLNDAQIASIKERLRLTEDQERMWPAVEAALRNIAYAKVRSEHRPAAPANMEAASLDTDSAEVQGLKSAAIPLLMSFNDEQKNEVRSLAHVMGLDKLAAQF